MRNAPTPQLTTFVVSSTEHGDLCLVTASNTHQAAAIALDVLRNAGYSDQDLAPLINRGWPEASDFAPVETSERGGTILNLNADGGAQ